MITGMKTCMRTGKHTQTMPGMMCMKTGMQRMTAYHQGTVWGFPLGGYYLAYLKVHGFSEDAKNTVRRQLGLIEAALREGCVGHIAEIYDGDDQSVSKGCFAQAWSVGELLRVFAAIEQKHM